MSDGDRLSVTGVHHLPSRRLALAARAEAIADLLALRFTSSRPPPPSEDDLGDADTLDVEPDPDPAPLAA